MAGLLPLLLICLSLNVAYGEEYLLGLAKTFKTAYINAVSGSKGGSVTYKLRESKDSAMETVDLPPLTRKLIPVFRSQTNFGISNKTLVINTAGGVSISVAYKNAAFAPLPVKGLGSKYIMPFCAPYQRRSFVVIASGKVTTSVNVTLRLNGLRFISETNKELDEGSVISKTLMPFQTYMFKVEHDITGTVIDSDNNVAVFMGSIESMEVDTFEQIPPVRSLGKEFVVAVNDANDATLNIISSEYGNRINFSDGRMIGARFHSEPIAANETLYFTTTKPAMVTICRIQKYRSSSAFVVVPPVELYATKDMALYIPSICPHGCGMKDKVVSNVKVMTSVSTKVECKSSANNTVVTWKEIPSSSYKVGTFQMLNDNMTIISANGSFAVLVFSSSFAQNGGYVSKEDTSLPKITTPLTSQPTTTLHEHGHTDMHALHLSMTTQAPKSEGFSFHKGGMRSTVAVVGLVCGLVIIVLIVVLAILFTYSRRRMNAPIEDSPPGTPELGAR